MNRIAQAFAIVLMLVSAAIAQAAAQPNIPQQKIVGAEEPVPAGEIVILQPSSIDNPDPNLISVSYGWVVVEDGKVKKRIRPESDGSIIFGAGLTAKKFLVVLSIDYVFMKAPAEKAGDRPQILQVQKILTAEVSVTGGQPSPNPPPGPNPPPQPTPIVDGKFKLATMSYQLVMSKVTLPAGQRAQAAQAVAQSMKAVVNDINSNKLTKIADILAQTKTANNAALKKAGFEPSTWDGFGLELKRTLTSLYAQKVLTTPADFAEAWTEIINGLSAVPAN